MTFAGHVESGCLRVVTATHWPRTCALFSHPHLPKPIFDLNSLTMSFAPYEISLTAASGIWMYVRSEVKARTA